MTQRYCKKCLLRDMPEGEYFKNLYDYIAGLPKEDKVRRSARLYVKNLLSGMCRLCGCYVEMRAAMKVRACPRVPALWQAWDQEEEQE